MLAAMIYRFGPFELDLARHELREDGAARPVEPQVFALIALLVENRERLLSRDELIEKVWDGRVVSDAAVSSRIKSARQALGDDGGSQRYIRTVHKQGFRFVADVQAGRAATSLSVTAAPADTRAPVQPEQPSIAVLPFRLLGDAGPYAPIAEALPHELIVDLSRLRWLLVTARGSSFRLSPGEDVTDVGRLLDVRYCLRGTVELSGPHLAVNVELSDTRDGRLVWAEGYRGPVGDVHEFREEIRSRVLAALEVRIAMHEADTVRLAVTEDLDAWSAFHRGLQRVYRFNRVDNAAAAELFQRSIDLDPGFARAHAGLSFVHFQSAFMHYADDVAHETSLARRHAERGLELDAIDPFVNFTMGRSHWLTGDLEGGLAWLERATAISPHYAQGIYARAWTEALSGRGREGREHVDLAMRLSPLDPLYYAMLGTRAFTHMVLGEDVMAAEWAERAARAPGAHVLIAMIASAAHDLAGDGGRAAAWAANVRERSPSLGREDFFRAFPIRPAAVRERVSDALARRGF
jgi:DNA-binding winged helix-turn-helix (wHTH) protein